jgi:hypothetical protein
MKTTVVCPYCGSDRVQPVLDRETGKKSCFCSDCDMEWDPEEQAGKDAGK